MKTDQFVRYISLAVLFGVMGIAIIYKLVDIQVFPQKEALAELNRAHEVILRNLDPARGQIYDRWGHLLAGNQEVFEVGVDLPSVQNPESIALMASALLGKDYNDVLDAIDFGDDEDLPYTYYPLADYVSAETKADIDVYMNRVDDNPNPGISASGATHSLMGVVFRAHLARTYPELTLASNILGFVSRDNTGYFGVEQHYDSLLSGVKQAVWVSRDPNKAAETPEAPEGASLVLTIDREIQATMEEILDKAIQDSGSEGGTILVMDPETGEILAMASYPRMDLNEYWRLGDYFRSDQPFNLGVHSYEPGSVFKVLTMAAALDSGTVEPGTTFVDTGAINVGGITIHNWDWGAWGPQDMIGCMQHSLNVCLAWVATQMGPNIFYQYLREFGFGHLSGVELSGEVTGRLKQPGDGDWYDADLGTNSFGQGIAVTPVQMLMAISAVANDGKMMVPHVVHSVINQGRQFEIAPQIAGTPISKKTARTLTEMLAVSLEQEASDALVEGYRVAGKTGTAEIAGEGGYTSSLTNASFVGWGPVDDPQFLVYIWLQKPTSSPWGSVVAAPVFSEVVTRLVVLMDIPPDGVRQAMAVP
ncbi:MAG: peptidoglycan D,D-transpeptidase FtsI family protein [Anaerolineales bacterium]|jgi:cell division protein FtsI/penicillin-binding protein 2